MSYRSFNEETSVEEARESCEFTVEALDAYPDPEVQTLARPLASELDQADAQEQRRRQARRLQVRASARSHTAGGILDDETRELTKDVLGAVRQDRQSPLFRSIFPQKPSAVVRMSLAPQIPVTEGMLTVLRRADTPAALRTAWEPRLVAAIDRGKAALDARKAAGEAVDVAQAEADRWIARLDQERRKIDGALTIYAANKGLPKDFNDRFFPAPPRRRPKEEGEPTEG